MRMNSISSSVGTSHVTCIEMNERLFRVGLATACALMIALFVSIASSGPAKADDLMAACQSDIDEICPNVKKGRGRITACLMAYDHRIGAICKKEVEKTKRSRTFQRFVPATMKTDPGPGLEAQIRKVCQSDVDKLCPGVKSGNARIVACLYSQEKSVSKPCASAAKQIADGRTAL